MASNFTFPKMSDICAEQSIGIARVEHYTPTDLDKMRASMKGMPIDSEKLALLHVDGVMMMSDTRYEHLTNYDIVRKARGNVLIAGLGLGMILHPILMNDEVSSVTIVEKYADVIALIQPTLPSVQRVHIECADIFTWDNKGRKFDVIYFDIWPLITGDNYPEMKTLHARARKWRSKGAWVSSWCLERCRKDYRSN